MVEHDLGSTGQAWTGSDDAQYVCFCKGKETEEEVLAVTHTRRHATVCLRLNLSPFLPVHPAPEHGPPNYQQTIPYTRQPLASIWEINHWIALRQQVSERNQISWS